MSRLDSTTTRSKIVHQLRDLVVSVRCSHPVRVGIDGVDCAGKSTLADELAAIMRPGDREVIRASIDGFHNPREVRYRQGRGSPLGYYEDTFNHGAILNCLLRPLGLGGDRHYKTAVFDYRTDCSVDRPWLEAEPDAILLFDGIFLQRPGLAAQFDFTIFIDISFEDAIRRARNRDQHLFGSPDEVETIYRERYIPGQKIYLDTVRPAECADVVISGDSGERLSSRFHEGEQG